MEKIISILLIIPIVYFIILGMKLFKEYTKVFLYRILFKEKDYQITIAFGKRILRTKKLNLHIIPIFSRITFGESMDTPNWKSVLVHLGGIIGIFLYMICLVPLIYFTNKRPEVIDFLQSGVFPLVFLRTIQDHPYETTVSCHYIQIC